MYIAAENEWGNVGFNGPDPYDILSPEAQQWVEANSGMLFNYRNNKDTIGNYGGNGTGAEIRVDMDMKRYQVADSHNLSSWEFDEEGQLVIDNSYDNREALWVQNEKLWYTKMTELSLLSNELQASVGGKSSQGDTIFLDHAQALITVEYMIESMNTSIEALVNIYNEAIDELDKNWENGIQLAQRIGPALDRSEILATLEEGGVTKYTVVIEPMAHYRTKIVEAGKIGEAFERLASDIKRSIKILVEKDEDLAEQIKLGV